MQIMIDTKQCPCRTLLDECIISGSECYEDDICSLCPLIRNGGIKLPEGHGKLKDEDEIKRMIECAKVKNESSKNFAENIIRFAQTVIEADKIVE